VVVEEPVPADNCDVCGKSVVDDCDNVHLTQREGSNAFAPYTRLQYRVCFGCILKAVGVPLEGDNV
jgi:hypothetical protein